MDKTFQNFLHDPASEKIRSAEDYFPRGFFERIETQDFTSLKALRDWTRERWPDYFTGHGKTMIPRLWAKYLEWKEAGDA